MRDPATADSCLVYVAWSKRGTCIYVGRSFIGMQRFRKHETFEENQKNIEVLELNWCTNRQEAIDLEKRLIREYKPRANKIKYTAGQMTPRRKFRIDHLKTYLLKLDDDVYEKWKRAADQDDMKLAEWIRSQCQRQISSPAREAKVRNGKRADNRAAPPPRMGNPARSKRRDRARRGSPVPRGEAGAPETDSKREAAGIAFSTGTMHRCDSPTCRICKFRRDVKASRK